jgi:hypothetical protein
MKGILAPAARLTVYRRGATMDIVYAILTALAGVASFAITVAGIEALSHRLVPVPKEARATFDDRELMSRARKGDAEARAKLAAAMEMTGTGAKVMIVMGWTIGAAVGTWVAGLINEDTVLRNSLIIAGFNALGVFFVGRMLPHPRWMAILGYLLPLASAHFTAVAVSGACLCH